MYFKKFEILFIFITFALLTFSSPIKNEKVKIDKKSLKSIKPTEKIQKITNGLSIVEAREQYNLLEISNLCEYNIDDNCINKVLNTTGSSMPHFKANGMKGSTFSVPKKDGKGYYVGRNLDLNKEIQNLILVSYPKDHYSSISTVNTDFIKQMDTKDQFTDNILMFTPFFATLDGLNEKGVSIAVNMNQGDVIKTGLNEYKLDMNVSFLMRYVLDYASSTDKAIDIIRGFELHNDFDFNVHFMISDANGKSVVVEYQFDKDKGTSKMIVTESSIVTNFNISNGKKRGLGKKQYDIIKKSKKTTPKMNVDDVKKTLKAAKSNTQCSIVYDLNNREAIYYVRGNYQQGYKVQFEEYHDDSFPPNPEDENDFDIVDIDVTKDIQKFGNSTFPFRVFEYEGDYGFNEFMEQGGAISEVDLFKYVSNRTGISIPFNNTNGKLPLNGNACSAFTVQNEKGDGYYFGRNYDFPNGDTIAVITRPKGGYASISTVDFNMINEFGQGKDTESVFATQLQSNSTSNYVLPDELLKEAVVYTPFDGMNEMGLSITINMVSDGSEVCIVDQNDEGKVHLTMSSLVRYLLDTAASVDDAVKKIKSINMHNHYVHFLISDASGKTVLIEFKNDSKEGVKMFVIETPLVTNYYLADDEELKEKNTEIVFNDRRYDSILNRLTQKPNQTVKDVRNTLRASNQDITIWSAVFDKVKKEVTYFIKNDFSKGYRIKLSDNKKSFEEDNTTVLGDEENDILTQESDDIEDDDETLVEEKN